MKLKLLGAAPVLPLLYPNIMLILGTAKLTQKNHDGVVDEVLVDLQ